MQTRLFDRLGRRVALTAAGEELHRYVVPMLRLAGEARSAVADVSSGRGGRLAIGASSTAATYILPSILRRFQELHGGVEMSVRTGPSPHIAELVLANNVDLGVVMDHREHPGLAQIELAHYANVVVASPDDPISQMATSVDDGPSGVAAEVLANCPLILMQHGASLRAYVDTMLTSHNVRAHVSIELDSVEKPSREDGRGQTRRIDPSTDRCFRGSSRRTSAGPAADRRPQCRPADRPHPPRRQVPVGGDARLHHAS